MYQWVLWPKISYNISQELPLMAPIWYHSPKLSFWTQACGSLSSFDCQIMPNLCHQSITKRVQHGFASGKWTFHRNLQHKCNFTPNWLWWSNLGGRSGRVVLGAAVERENERIPRLPPLLLKMDILSGLDTSLPHWFQETKTFLPFIAF